MGSAARSVRVIATDRTAPATLMAFADGGAAAPEDRIGSGRPRAAPVREAEVASPAQEIHAASRPPGGEPAGRIERSAYRVVPPDSSTRDIRAEPVTAQFAPPYASNSANVDAPSVTWRWVQLTPDAGGAFADAQHAKRMSPGGTRQVRVASPRTLAARSTQKFDQNDFAASRGVVASAKSRSDDLGAALAYGEPYRARRLTLDRALDSYFSSLDR